MKHKASEVFSLLSKALRQEVEDSTWERATEIQVLAIPRILKGENVLLIAPTGTGKTEAAVYPVFEQFLRTRVKHSLKGISIIYITPLRALNRDIFRRLIKTGERLGIEVQVRHGDTTQYARRKQALNPPDMLITTPETLQAILPGKRMSRHLQSIRWVVIDEVHELATSKRGVQLSIGLERLRKLADRDFQRIGLSATVGSPERIANFLCGEEKNCRILKTFESKDLEIWVDSPTAEEKDGEIAKKVMLSPGSVKRIQRLFEVIDDYESSLIFTNTREHAEALSSRMIALRPEVKVGVHHGSLSKTAR
ncbi:MAG: DEAD/DEAH box helicase, partial [Candidatus Bathyarchaeia archaeon]